MDIEVYDANNNILHIFSGTDVKANIGDVMYFDFCDVEECAFIVVEDIYIDKYLQKVRVERYFED